jgi:hypothetical protein
LVLVKDMEDKPVAPVDDRKLGEKVSILGDRLRI